MMEHDTLTNNMLYSMDKSPLFLSVRLLVRLKLISSILLPSIELLNH